MLQFNYKRKGDVKEMLKLMGVVGSIMTVVGISSGILNRSMLVVAAIGLALMSISIMFLPKNDNF